ncbi:unnamed protein product [Soboliphyme baturini]|uniref:G_PROTEIN_RECEP_F1_2 domain-containing protein n=1 Tax=Soboliphyme baturini TaxID=241478 RepID=A0A183IKI4_9BILA|nr:unnamed protein product [Soboliphyme baturini]
MISSRWISRMSCSPLVYITFSLTMSDAWMCLSMGSSFILQSYLPYVWHISISNSLCFGLAYEAIRMGAMITSVLHLMLLAVSHYLSIMHPLRYRSLLTPEISLLCIVLSWLMPTACFLLFFSMVPGQAFLSSECSEITFFCMLTFRAIVATLICAPLALCILIYMRIFYVALRSQRRRRRNEGNTSRVRRSYNFKAVVTTGLVLGK